jgi:hypothetical protein
MSNYLGNYDTNVKILKMAWLEQQHPNLDMLIKNANPDECLAKTGCEDDAPDGK